MVSYKSLLFIALLGLANAVPECNVRPANQNGGENENPGATGGGHAGGKVGGNNGGQGGGNNGEIGGSGSGGKGGSGSGEPGGSGVVGGGGGGRVGLKDSSEGPLAGKGKIKATATVYGANDLVGSGNCVKPQACGFYAKHGYSAAASQALFGVGPNQGAGPACGTCWKVTVETDSSHNPIPDGPRSIKVVVDNLCPTGGNSICAQPNLQTPNQYGAFVNFDLCMDSGAQTAMFGQTGIGLGIGYAERIDCAEWDGEIAGKPWGK